MQSHEDSVRVLILGGWENEYTAAVQQMGCLMAPTTMGPWDFIGTPTKRRYRLKCPDGILAAPLLKQWPELMELARRLIAERAILDAT